MSEFKFKVKLIEYERGWGSKIDEIKEFNSYEDAEKFIEEFNSENTEKVVTDWYMIAERANYNKVS